MDLDGLTAADSQVNRYYTWGLDLSGLNGDQSRDRQGAVGLHGAGGIGGLLAVKDVKRTRLEPIPIDPTIIVGGASGETTTLELEDVVPEEGGAATLQFANESGDSAEMGLTEAGSVTSTDTLAFTAADGSQTVLSFQGVEEVGGDDYVVFSDDAGTVGVSALASGAGGATQWRLKTRKYLYFYDANGNVGQVVDRTNGAIVAKYEYDPFGNIVGPDTHGDGDFDSDDDPGPYATSNPFRFSTKYWDDESGLGYWGYRYYTPRLRRWLSRDPKGENGGLNLYAFVLNNPVGKTDPLGLEC